MQMVSLSREALEHAWALQDAWKRVIADGVVTTGEVALMSDLVEANAHRVDEVDAAQAYGLAATRRGPESRNARDLREHAVEVMEMGKRTRPAEPGPTAEEVAAFAAELGLTPERYAQVLTDALVAAITDKRAEGRAILEARQKEAA